MKSQTIGGLKELNLPAELNAKLEKFMHVVRASKEFKKVEFIILYGSVAAGRANKLSDVDVCVYFGGGKDEAFDFQVKLSYDEKIDVQMFQQLPLYVRIEVLKGKVLYAKSKRFVYDVAYRTIQEFEDFKPYYYEYINAI